MRRIENVAHFALLEREAKKRLKALHSNCLLLPGDIERYSGRGRLYYQETESGLYIFCDEGRVYRLYYYTASGRDILLNKLPKPALVSFVYREGQKPPDIEEAQGLWLLCGARPYSVNRKMSLPLGEYALSEETLRIGERIFKAQQARERHAGEILTLWRSVMTSLNSYVPDEAELMEEIAAGRVFCITEGGKVCAADRMTVQNKRASIWLVSVRPEMRRMGLGELLEGCSLNAAKAMGCAFCFLWVAEDNAAAIQMYTKRGFFADRELSEEWIIPAT